jgi:DNA-binding transcriptional ArsR family regulator
MATRDRPIIAASTSPFASLLMDNLSPGIAPIAALIGDPTRSIMLTALMEGRALTVGELAGVAGITIQTASAHLAKLEAASLVAVEKQGRHRYLRLAHADVADLIERLMGIAQRARAPRVATGPRQLDLRRARLCYDHLAGEHGVALFDALQNAGRLSRTPSGIALTPAGRAFCAEFGIDLAPLERARRPLCRACLDWSERRDHLAGALGAALLQRLLALRWVRRTEGRVLAFTPEGVRGFEQTFGIRSDRLTAPRA